MVGSERGKVRMMARAVLFQDIQISLMHAHDLTGYPQPVPHPKAVSVPRGR